MVDPTPFAPHVLESAFRSAPTPGAARERLDLLLERVDRLEAGRGKDGARLAPDEAATLRRRVHEAAGQYAPELDAGLLAALLLASTDERLPVPAVLRRTELAAQVRAVAEPVYAELLDRIEDADTARRVFLWWAVECLARAARIPPRIRDRVLGYLHTLPREILAPFPEEAPPIEVIRRRPIEDFSPPQQRAIEGSAVVSALVADRELPPEYLQALAPRALRFSDPVTRRQIAEHPRADARVWREFLSAPSLADRALPGHVDRAWADPEVRGALRALGDDPALPERARAALRLRLCRAAPVEWARHWLPEVLGHGGLSALALLVYDRPDLAFYARDEDCERLLLDPEVRAALRPAGAERADPEALAELRAGPGGGFVERLLDR